MVVDIKFVPMPVNIPVVIAGLRTEVDNIADVRFKRPRLVKNCVVLLFPSLSSEYVFELRMPYCNDYNFFKGV